MECEDDGSTGRLPVDRASCGRSLLLGREEGSGGMLSIMNNANNRVRG